MPEPTDKQKTQRALAAHLITSAADIYKKLAASDTPWSILDIQATTGMAEIGASFALLHLGDQVRELVEVQRQQLEQQKLANLLAAFDAAGLLAWEDTYDAREYVRARIGDIFNRGTEADQ